MVTSMCILRLRWKYVCMGVRHEFLACYYFHVSDNCIRSIWVCTLWVVHEIKVIRFEAEAFSQLWIFSHQVQCFSSIILSYIQFRILALCCYNHAVFSFMSGASTILFYFILFLFVLHLRSNKPPILLRGTNHNFFNQYTNFQFV